MLTSGIYSHFYLWRKNPKTHLISISRYLSHQMVPFSLILKSLNGSPLLPSSINSPFHICITRKIGKSGEGVREKEGKEERYIEKQRSLLKHTEMGAEEKVQLLKWQPPKHEDLNLFPRSHIRKEGMVVPKPNPSTEEGEIVGTLGLAGSQPRRN